MRHDPAHGRKQHAARKEEQVEQELMRVAGQDVMEAEQLMIDQAFEKIEETPAAEHRPAQSFAGHWCRRRAAGAKKKPEANDRERPDGEVEKSVLGDLPLESRDRIRRARFGGADQVVPAENLVEHNAVEEAAQAEAEVETRAANWMAVHS